MGRERGRIGGKYRVQAWKKGWNEGSKKGGWVGGKKVQGTGLEEGRKGVGEERREA